MEKLIGAGSFGGFINHLTCHHATLPTSLSKFNLLFMVQTTILTFLGCWALIVHTLLIHFQYDDHPILLNVVAHVETDTSLFQMALQDVQAMCTLGCPLSSPTLWELNGSILSPIVGFFNGSLTQVRVYFTFNRRSFKYYVNMFPLICGSKDKHLVISFSYHTSISFTINLLSYNTMYPSWLVTSYSCPPFTMSMWSYHWQFRYPFALMSMQDWMYSSPWHTLGYCCNYCVGKWNTCLKEVSHLFPHHT